MKTKLHGLITDVIEAYDAQKWEGDEEEWSKLPAAIEALRSEVMPRKAGEKSPHQQHIDDLVKLLDLKTAQLARANREIEALQAQIKRLFNEGASVKIPDLEILVKDFIDAWDDHCWDGNIEDWNTLCQLIGQMRKEIIQDTIINSDGSFYSTNKELK
jgi:hypothetical protein